MFPLCSPVWFSKESYRGWLVSALQRDRADIPWNQHGGCGWAQREGTKSEQPQYLGGNVVKWLKVWLHSQTPVPPPAGRKNFIKLLDSSLSVSSSIKWQHIRSRLLGRFNILMFVMCLEQCLAYNTYYINLSFHQETLLWVLNFGGSAFYFLKGNDIILHASWLEKFTNLPFATPIQIS